MATELKWLNTEVSVTRFFGGSRRGTCLQLTGPKGWVQLTRADAAELAKRLADFARDPMSAE